LQDLFSNEILQHSLESLEWQHAENDKSAWEIFKITSIEAESEVFALILRALQKKLRLGDYLYTINPHSKNLLERSGPSIVKKRKYNALFTVSQKFKEVIKPVTKTDGIVQIE